MVYQLTREEQETILLTDAAKDTFEVGTLDPVYIRKLDGLCEKYPEHYRRAADNQRGEHIYIMPKRLLRFGKPLKAETLEAMRERGREAAKYLRTPGEFPGENDLL